MEPCIMHERAEKHLRLGMLVDVGLRVTTHRQCQPCDAAQCAVPRGELWDGACLQVWVVEQVSVSSPGTRPSSAGLIATPFSLGKSLHPNLVELFDVSTLLLMSTPSSTISSTCQLLGGHKWHACSCSFNLLQDLLKKKIWKIQRKRPVNHS